MTLRDFPKRTILVSVLNWNSAAATFRCIQSILELEVPNWAKLSILVIDNGSNEEQWSVLKESLKTARVSLIRNQKNLGFAGGHNIALRMGLCDDLDYVWLVNSDAVVTPDSLNELIKKMEEEPRCGAASPLILSIEDESVIDFCGARHDWENINSITSTSVEETVAMEEKYPREMWLMGAAIFLRVEAIRQIGLLDEKLFAYYEDNDLCVRLSSAGWSSKMAFESRVLHNHPESRPHEKGAYYFYLMARNSFYFWLKHTPKRHKKLLRLKLIDRTMLVANRLHYLGLHEKSNACLLGILDAQLGLSGEWNLNRSTPFYLNILRRLLWKNHVHHLQLRN